MKLTKDPLFRLTFIIGMVVSIGSAIAIGFFGIEGLGFCVRPECFSNFLTYYAFPFKALTATAAIMGIIAMMHRSKQTATQIELSTAQIKLSTRQIQTTINQNMHLNYFSHLKDFKETIKSLEFKHIQYNNINKLYKLLFPNNSPNHFTSQGTMNYFENSLNSMIESHDIIKNKLSTTNNKTLISYIDDSFSDIAFKEIELNHDDVIIIKKLIGQIKRNILLSLNNIGFKPIDNSYENSTGINDFYTLYKCLNFKRLDVDLMDIQQYCFDITNTPPNEDATGLLYYVYYLLQELSKLDTLLEHNPSGLKAKLPQPDYL